jgi:hypothetical protein
MTDSRVKLNETSDSEEDKSDDDDKVNHIMKNSMNHLKGIRSRDYSESTSKSNPTVFSKKTPNQSTVFFSGLPSNAVIQESLKKQYSRTGVSRKDYSKRTRVSVLDSSLSSINKNSVLGDYKNDRNNIMPRHNLPVNEDHYTQHMPLTNTPYNLKDMSGGEYYQGVKKSPSANNISSISPNSDDRIAMRDISNLYSANGDSTPCLISKNFTLMIIFYRKTKSSASKIIRKRYPSYPV